MEAIALVFVVLGALGVIEGVARYVVGTDIDDLLEEIHDE